MKKFFESGSFIRFRELIFNCFIYLLVCLFIFIRVEPVVIAGRVYFMLSLFALVFIISDLKYIFIQFQKRGPNIDMVKQVEKCGFTKVKDYPFYVKDVTMARIKELKVYYNTLSKKQRSVFTHFGYNFVIGPTADIVKWTHNKKISGLFDSKSKVIYIYNEVIFANQNNPNNYKELKNVFYHEWGHFVDFSYNLLCYSKKFRSLYMQEKYNHTSGSVWERLKMIPFYERYIAKKHLPYYLTSEIEYFACNYSDYRLGLCRNQELVDLFDDIEEVKYKERVICEIW